MKDCIAGYSWVTCLFVRTAGEVSGLRRAKATLLMEAMLEKVANEQEARKHAEKQNREVVSDRLMLKPSELWKVAVDERLRGVLQSESSSKDMGKGNRQSQYVRSPRVVQLLPRQPTTVGKRLNPQERAQTQAKAKANQQNMSPKGKSRDTRSGKGKQSKD